MTARMYYDNDVEAAALEGQTVAVIGYGSQGHAHAQNLRDSGVDVVVGLAEGSKSRKLAEEAGFRVATVADAVRQADVVMILVPDTAQKAVYDAEIEPNLKPGALLMFAHGFNIRFERIKPGAGVDVGMVAPKGPGHLLRSVYVAGGGVPALFAVEQDPSGTARARTLAYARAIGATRAGVLETTFKEETETDLFGEQALLCGGVSALIKAAFETLVEAGYQPELAYFETMHELKLIVDLMYRGGLNFMRFSVSDTAEFGDYVSGPRVAEGVKATMKDVLSDIQSGSFANRWIAVQEAGGGEFQELRKRDREHQIEQVGAELRAQMPFLNPVVVDAGVAQAAASGGSSAGAHFRVEGGGLMAPATRPIPRPAGPLAPPNRVRVFDTTLRDGEQAPGAGLTAAEKLEVARQLARLKVDVIEAGFPAASDGDFEAVRRIAQETKGGIAVAALARCRDGDPQRAIEAIKVAERPHLHVFIATSDIHLKHKLRISRDQALAEATRWVRYGREQLGRDVEIEFSAEDASRTDPDFLMQVYEAVVEAGRLDDQHPGHGRLRDPVGVRGARGAGRRPARQPGDHLRPLPQRPGARHREHPRGRAGRSPPGRGHDQRPRRARGQRLARGGRDGPSDPADPVPHAAPLTARTDRRRPSPTASPRSTSPRRRGS